jgi:hypothetical protein
MSYDYKAMAAAIRKERTELHAYRREHGLLTFSEAEKEIRQEMLLRIEMDAARLYLTSPSRPVYEDTKWATGGLFSQMASSVHDCSKSPCRGQMEMDSLVGRFKVAIQ